MIRKIEASREIAQTLAGNPNVSYIPGSSSQGGRGGGGGGGSSLLLNVGRA